MMMLMVCHCFIFLSAVIICLSDVSSFAQITDELYIIILLILIGVLAIASRRGYP